MQVANRTTRRYITPTPKNSAGNIRINAKKQPTIPSQSHSSPKKIVENTKEQPTLKKLIDRFRYDEPQARPERDSIGSDFWWLHDELKSTYEKTVNDDDDEERKSNLPEFIEIFPSTDIDHELNKRASLLLNQTFSAHSSDVGQVSSTGLGSTASTTMTATTTTTSTFQPPVTNERAARPIFTRINERDGKFNFKNENGEDDILYQWRLRRRLEQAQNGEPITFPSKIANRTEISPARSLFPTIPIEIPTIVPPPPPPPSNAKQLSPKRERQQSSTATNTEPEPPKQPVSTTPVPTRQYSEVATQTLQDACIQTSPIKEDHLLSSSNTNISQIDQHPTRDGDNHSSIWHRPPPRSKSELTQVSSSPSPVKRHHHHHHHRHSFRPVVITEHPHRSNVYPSTIVQSSQDSTLTQVTSIMIHDQNRNHDQSQEQIFQNENDDDQTDYSNDEILNMLMQKRDELLMTFRDIEQRLTTMTVE